MSGLGCACLGCLQLLCIRTGEVGVIERCGKFSYLAHPGLNCYIFPVCRLAGKLSLKVHQLDVSVETKTKDNVFVKIVISVQYSVQPDNVEAAFYKLTDQQQQIRAYIFDVIRSTIPTLDLDDAFTSKDHIADAVREQLQKKMEAFGYQIVRALVTDLTPDVRVKMAMNEINANRRLRMAAQYKAEAEKISIVKHAEAVAESKYLSGVGVANQRKAIVEGLKDSVGHFAGSVNGTTPQDVMGVLLTSQYIDMLSHVGAQSKTTSVLVSKAPDTMKK